MFYILMKDVKIQSHIVQLLGRHKSTINRALSPNIWGLRDAIPKQKPAASHGSVPLDRAMLGRLLQKSWL